MGEVVLRAQEIDKGYGTGPSRFEALKNVSVDVVRHESLAIVGKSGSGKSTLMHLLALLDRPDAGVLEIDGQDSTRLPTRDVDRLRNTRFGFVFQQFFLTPSESVLENVVLPLTVAGVSRATRQRRGMEVLDQLGLADKARNRATDLSGGQKQRVVIARALVGEPDVIFADEPTGNLDITTGAIVEDLLFGLNRERGITLVLVTHDEELAARCDRRVYIADGQLKAEAAA